MLLGTLALFRLISPLHRCTSIIILILNIGIAEAVDIYKCISYGKTIGNTFYNILLAYVNTK